MRRKMRKILKWNKKIEQQGSKIDRLPSGENNSDIKLNCFCVYDVCLSTVKICILSNQNHVCMISHFSHVQLFAILWSVAH